MVKVESKWVDGKTILNFASDMEMLPKIYLYTTFRQYFVFTCDTHEDTPELILAVHLQDLLMRNGCDKHQRTETATTSQKAQHYTKHTGISFQKTTFQKTQHYSISQNTTFHNIIFEKIHYIRKHNSIAEKKLRLFRKHNILVNTAFQETHFRKPRISYSSTSETISFKTIPGTGEALLYICCVFTLRAIVYNNVWHLQVCPSKCFVLSLPVPAWLLFHVMSWWSQSSPPFVITVVLVH